MDMPLYGEGLCEQIEDYDKAIECYQRAIDLYPDYEEAKENKEKALQMQKEKE